MTKETKEPWTNRLYDDTFPDELEPRCCYCGSPVSSDKQFCSENCEYLFYTEMDVWADREEEHRKEKEE